MKWMPAWGDDRMHEMVAERPDWCISRQRFWGVPLIVFYCDACGKQLKDVHALRHVLPFFEREGADAWYTHSAEELLPPGTKCSCGAAKWRKETDILDVWFDSGSTHLAVLSEKDGTWPADVYLEGPDQYRGWFQSSLLVGIGIRGRAPYRQVVTHGWTLDEKGAPMSKSLGNAMYPAEICEKWGADMLRIWVVVAGLHDDVRMSEAMMTQLSEAYRKIRNTFRFALSNLYDFDPARDRVADADLWEIDAWMLRRTGALVRAVPRVVRRISNFHRVYHALHDFCSVDLSAFYFDMLKDRLYTFAPKNRGRRSAQTAVYRIASALLRLHRADSRFHRPRKSGSILPHVPASPKACTWRCSRPPRNSSTRWIRAREKLGPPAGCARRSVEGARAGCEPRRQFRPISKRESRFRRRAIWQRCCRNTRVAARVFHRLAGRSREPALATARRPRESKDWRFASSAPTGKKCERCWNYSTHVGENAEYPTVCERCVAALAEIERDGGILAGGAKS